MPPSRRCGIGSPELGARRQRSGRGAYCRTTTATSSAMGHRPRGHQRLRGVGQHTTIVAIGCGVCLASAPFADCTLPVQHGGRPTRTPRRASRSPIPPAPLRRVRVEPHHGRDGAPSVRDAAWDHGFASPSSGVCTTGNCCSRWWWCSSCRVCSSKGRGKAAIGRPRRLARKIRLRPCRHPSHAGPISKRRRSPISTTTGASSGSASRTRWCLSDPTGRRRSS